MHATALLQEYSVATGARSAGEIVPPREKPASVRPMARPMLACENHWAMKRL